MTAGGRHELPQAGCADRRFRLRDEGAFDHRQQGQLGRHAALFDFVDDVEQVFVTAAQRAFDAGRIGGVLAFEAADQIGVDFIHLEAFADALPDIVAIAQQDVVLLHHRLPGGIGQVVELRVCLAGKAACERQRQCQLQCVFHRARPDVKGTFKSRPHGARVGFWRSPVKD